MTSLALNINFSSLSDCTHTIKRFSVNLLEVYLVHFQQVHIKFTNKVNILLTKLSEAVTALHSSAAVIFGGLPGNLCYVTIQP